MTTSNPLPENKMGLITTAVRDLLPEIRAGNPLALNELVTIAYQRLEQIIRRKKKIFSGHGVKTVRGDEQTGIIMTELFLRLHTAVTGNKLSELKHPSGVWKIAADNVMFILLDFARDRKRRAGGNGSDPVAIEQIAESTRLRPDLQLDELEVLEAIHQLPEEERAVISMHYYMGLSQSDITKVLQQDDPTMYERKVSRIFNRAKQTLRRKLDGGAT